MACLELGDCKELMIVERNGCCFPALSTCDTQQRKLFRASYTKLLYGACAPPAEPPPPSPPMAPPICFEASATGTTSDLWCRQDHKGQSAFSSVSATVAAQAIALAYGGRENKWKHDARLGYRWCGLSFDEFFVGSIQK